jgi:RsiW-degrading membrane proteinase PrsW (M82 family)
MTGPLVPGGWGGVPPGMSPGPAGPYGAPAVPPIPPQLLRRRRSPLTWVTMIVLGLGALVIAILIFLTGGPVASLITTLLAAISFPLVILVLFWLDRYEPEPARYRLAAIGWGGVVAVVLSVVAEQLLFALPGTSTFIDTAIIAPIVEEAGKGLFLVVVVVFRRAQVNGLLDGLIYGALVGVGFAFVEDIVYYLSSLEAGALPVTFFLRGVMGPFAHPLFTSATGIGVGIALTTRRPALRVLAPILGYLAAVIMHGIWNGSAFLGGDGFFITYAVIMLPLLAVVLAIAIWARSREGKMLAAALEQTAAMGWIRPEEIHWVARLSDRMSARAYAKRIGGKQAAAALHEYQQTMIEIAFLHNRAVNQTAPRDINERMNALLQHAAAIRPYVIMPPPPGMPGPGWPSAPPPAGWPASQRPPGA